MWPAPSSVFMMKAVHLPMLDVKKDKNTCCTLPAGKAWFFADTAGAETEGP